MKRLFYFIFSLWLISDISLTAQSDVPSLDTAKKDFEKQVEGFKKELEEFNVTYEKYLTKLGSELKVKGDLKNLLLIRKEKAEFRKATQQEPIKFVKLQQLRTLYNKGREMRRDQMAIKLKPILSDYLADIIGIQKVLTKADEIDEALVVKKERDRIKVLMRDPKTTLFTLGVFIDPFIASETEETKMANRDTPTTKDATKNKDPLRIKNTRWAWGSGGYLTLKRNGDAIHTRWRGAVGKWEWNEDGSLRLTGSAGTLFSVKFSGDNRGTVTGPNGATTIIKRED